MTNLRWSALSLALMLISIVQVVEANITAVDMNVTNNTNTTLTFRRYLWDKEAAWPGGAAPYAPYSGWILDKAAEPKVIQPGETKLVEWIGAGLADTPGSLLRTLLYYNKSTVIRGGSIEFADGRPPVQLWVEAIPTNGRGNIFVRLDGCAALLEPGEIGKGCLATGLTQIGLGTCPGCTLKDPEHWSLANGLWSTSRTFVNAGKTEVIAKGLIGNPYPNGEFIIKDK
ncbi:TPA: hypothetical protein DDZ86_04800 [Candidatus Dependentiae bacterium]|nr:MAG: hypothetical protein A2Y17_09605 [Clostridiales bacterium GWF2_38_85]HBL98931.1 hypothetical protein [Candidatus Dependentiae bacterium]